MLYDVEIREVSSRVVQVEANSACEAEEKARGIMEFGGICIRRY